MSPDAATRALSSIEVDVSSIEPGQAITVKWRGKPVFIRNRTDKEIEEAKAVDLGDLVDPIARNENAATEELPVSRFALRYCWSYQKRSCTGKSSDSSVPVRF